MIIAIDGPSGTGKTTVAQRVAEALGIPYFDTGAMYRAFTWFLIKNRADIEDGGKIEELLSSFVFSIDASGKKRRYFVNNQEVTEEIRSQEVTALVSAVSALPVVRGALWKIQRQFAARGNAVFEGRDMGTVVFPKAEVKIFLNANPEVRAERRLAEIQAKNPYLKIDRIQMLRDIMKRDEIDSTRKLAPLKRAEDAFEIDTTDLTIDDVVTRILDYSAAKTKKRMRSWTQPGMKCLYRCVLCLAWCTFKVLYRHKIYGLEHYYEGAAILAANHTSFLDPPAVSLSWPQEVHFLAREDLFRGVFGKFIAALNAHPVKGGAGDAAVFKTICTLLKEGKKVVLFPEGARSNDGQLQEIKPGISLFMSRTGAAIIPVYVYGTFEVWSKQRKFPKLKGKTACVFGSPLLWEDFVHLDKKEAQIAIAKKLEEKILALKRWYHEGAHGVPP